jgi:hypothetical protein
VTGDVLQRPEMVADRLGAELLRQRNALGFGLAVGMVGADGEAEPVAERDDPSTSSTGDWVKFSTLLR